MLITFIFLKMHLKLIKDSATLYKSCAFLYTITQVPFKVLQTQILNYLNLMYKFLNRSLYNSKPRSLCYLFWSSFNFILSSSAHLFPNADYSDSPETLWGSKNLQPANSPLVKWAWRTEVDTMSSGRHGWHWTTLYTSFLN